MPPGMANRRRVPLAERGTNPNTAISLLSSSDEEEVRGIDKGNAEGKAIDNGRGHGIGRVLARGQKRPGMRGLWDSWLHGGEYGGGDGEGHGDGAGKRKRRRVSLGEGFVGDGENGSKLNKAPVKGVSSNAAEGDRSWIRNGNGKLAGGKDIAKHSINNNTRNNTGVMRRGFRSDVNGTERKKKQSTHNRSCEVVMSGIGGDGSTSRLDECCVEIPRSLFEKEVAQGRKVQGEKVKSNEKETGVRPDSSDYGADSRDEAHLLTAADETEKGRRWVDEAIESVIKETQDLSHPVRTHDNMISRSTQGRSLPSIRPPNTFLSFFDLVGSYGLFQEGAEWLEGSWRRWLGNLGLNEEVYLNTRPDEPSLKRRRAVESIWMEEPMEKRRIVEHISILLKAQNPFEIATIPLRTAPSKMVTSTNFATLEARYFIYRSYKDYMELASARTAWRHEIEFPLAATYPLPQSGQQIAHLDRLYAQQPPTVRLAIEQKARFLKMKANPTDPNWTTFEQRYELYPASCFSKREDYLCKRKQWLQSMSLDFWPYSYSNTLPDYRNESVEIAWSEIPPAHRAHLEEHAKKLKDEWSHFLNFWAAVEDIFGYTCDIDFGGDDQLYEEKRAAWLRETGMSFELLDKDALQVIWMKMSKEQKTQITKRARLSKEAFCKEVESEKTLEEQESRRRRARRLREEKEAEESARAVTFEQVRPLDASQIHAQTARSQTLLDPPSSVLKASYGRPSYLKSSGTVRWMGFRPVIFGTPPPLRMPGRASVNPDVGSEMMTTPLQSQGQNPIQPTPPSTLGNSLTTPKSGQLRPASETHYSS